jgi:hypothetical protein
MHFFLSEVCLLFFWKLETINAEMWFSTKNNNVNFSLIKGDMLKIQLVLKMYIDL